MKQRQNKFATTGVATPAMWNGDLSNITDTNGDKYTMYDPLTTAGQWHSHAISKQRDPDEPPEPVRENFPERLAHAKSARQSLDRPELPDLLSDRQDQHTWTIKIDHNFSEKDTISGRFTKSPYFNAQYGGKYGFPPPGCTNCGGTAERTTGFIPLSSLESRFSPTFLNELQVSDLPLCHSLRNARRQHEVGRQTGLAESVRRHRLADGLYRRIEATRYNMFYYGGWDGDNNHNQNLTAYRNRRQRDLDQGKAYDQVRIQRPAGVQQRQRTSAGGGLPQLLCELDGIL